MRGLFFFLVAIALSQNISAYGQVLDNRQVKIDKPVLDTSAFLHWPRVQNPLISQDGEYLGYSINYENPKRSDLVIQKYSGSWKTIIPDIRPYSYVFTGDNRILLFLNAHDSLGIFATRKQTLQYVSNVSQFRVLQWRKRWKVICLFKNKDLTVSDLPAGAVRTFSGVESFTISNDDQRLFLKRESKKDKDTAYQLCSLNFSDNSFNVLWEGKDFSNLILYDKGPQLAFMTKGGDSAIVNDDIYFASQEGQKPYKIADDRLLHSQHSMQLQSLEGFSVDGERIFLNVRRPLRTSEPPISVKIWHTQDLYLFPKEPSQQFVASFNLINKKYIFLQEENETTMLFLNKSSDSVAFISSRKGDPVESNWNPASKPRFYLISTITGKKREVNIEPTEMSPDGKFLVGANAQNDYVIRNLSTGHEYNLSNVFCDSLNRVVIDGEKRMDLKTEAWYPTDSSLLLFDGNDLWKVNPLGFSPPTCITNGYGHNHHIIFHLAGHQIVNGVKRYLNIPTVLTSFNDDTKEYGFFQKDGDGEKNPVLLSKGAYFVNPLYPIFTSKSDIPKMPARFILMRNCISESLNCYTTEDFKQFRRISQIFPERKYNWLTSELMTINQGENRFKAVVYKPENFDPVRKYPVIFYYYEKMSDDAYTYITPEPSNGGLNIPWFVSHGYIVCTPDIDYTKGEPGESALRAILRVVDHLKGFNWVDIRKMGLYGHSFGGYETNYIVTHTTIFAAACAASATSDMISSYGSLRSGGVMNSMAFEIGQYRMKASLWETPDLYIRNSPIFQADNVVTPILLMNNKGDGSVPFEQGVQFFTALRRLNKQAWLLQYENEGHTLSDYTNAIDFTLRITEFFEYYLKDKPAASWMNVQINRNDSTIETR